METIFRSQVRDPECRQAFEEIRKLFNDAQALDPDLTAIADLATLEGFYRKTGSGTVVVHKSNLTATADPTTGDDTGDGYSIGSVWINVTLDKIWMCTDATLGAALWQLCAPSTGSGDVNGPASSTDNAIARWDGTTGKLLQNSGVLIDDSNNLTIPSSAKLFLRDTDSYVHSFSAGQLTLHGESGMILESNAFTFTETSAGGGFDILKLNPGTGSAQNYLIIKNSATAATGPEISSFGVAADVGINVVPRGTGLFQYRGVEVATVANAQPLDSDLTAIANLATTEGFYRKTGAGTVTVHKSNLSASADPTVNDDSGDGYSVGSLWINTTADKVFIAADVTVGAAVWKEAGGGGGTPGGADTQIQYNNAGAFGGIAAFTWNGTALTIGTNTKLQFRDTDIFSHSDTDGNRLDQADGTAWYKGLTNTKIGVHGTVKVGDGSTEIDMQPGADRKANLGNASTRFEQAHIAELLHLYGVSGSSQAALQIDQQTAPSIPNDGDVWHDATQDALFSFHSGMRTGLGGVIMVGSGANVSNTTTKTSILGTVNVGTKTIAANFGATGKVLYIRASGFLKTKASSPGNLTIDVDKASTNIATTGAFAITAGMAGTQDNQWTLELYLTFHTDSQVDGHGWFFWVAGGTLGARRIGTGGSSFSTAAEDLEVKVTWSTADVDNVWTTHQVIYGVIG